MRARALVPLLALAWVGAALALDALGHRPVPEGPFDAIVVAGCRVRPDGQPSTPLAARVSLAAALYHRGLSDTVLLTGGLGDHPPTEARAAAGLALSLGVPAEALVLEETSTSTEENARAAAALMPLSRVLLVTDAYHVLRAERVFRRHVPEVVGVGARSPLDVRARGALREVPALAWYALTGRLTAP